MDPFGVMLLRGLLLIGLLTVLISVMAYLSRDVFASTISKWLKAFWVLGLTAVVMIVVLVGLWVMLLPYFEFD